MPTTDATAGKCAAPSALLTETRLALREAHRDVFIVGPHLERHKKNDQGVIASFLFCVLFNSDFLLTMLC